MSYYRSLIFFFCPGYKEEFNKNLENLAMCVPNEPSYFLLESIPVYLEKCNIFKLPTLERGILCWGHRLNMEIWIKISKVYLGSMYTAVPSPLFGLINEGAFGQPR